MQASYRPTRARLEGYRRAAEAAGLKWDRDVLVYESFEDTPSAGIKAAAALLSQSPHPTAILAMSDQLALGVLGYARAQGIRVPDELSVVGYDDALPVQGVPALTTVRQPHVEKGRRAALGLIALLQREEARSVILSTELVVRESAAAPPALHDENSGVRPK